MRKTIILWLTCLILGLIATISIFSYYAWTDSFYNSTLMLPLIIANKLTFGHIWEVVYVAWSWCAVICLSILVDSLIFKTPRTAKRTKILLWGIGCISLLGTMILIAAYTTLDEVNAALNVGFDTYDNLYKRMEFYQWTWFFIACLVSSFLIWYNGVFLQLWWWLNGETEKASTSTQPALLQQNATDVPVSSTTVAAKDEELLSLQQSVDDNPQSYEAWTELGYRQHELGQETDALASANKALEILSTKNDVAHEDSNKGYARAWMVRGAALSTMEGKEVDALAACEEALGYEPNNLEALYYKGMVFSFQEHDNLAHRTYDRILQLDPTYTPALLGKGLLYLAKDNFDAALSVASEVIEQNQDNAAAWRLQGTAYNYKGERVGAEGDLEQGNHLLDMAIASFNKAIEIDPSDPNTYLLKAGPYLATGDYGKALDTLNQGLKVAPNDKPLQEAKAKVVGIRTNEMTRKVAGTAGKIALRGGIEFAKGSADIAKLFLDVLRKS